MIRVETLTPASSAIGQRSIAILALCFGAATFEGVDIQSMGFAGPQLMPAFGLDPAQFGLAASSSLAGLVIGGAIGGRLADYVGHARVLLFSMVMLGLFSLATPFCSFFPLLVLVRFLVGLGLGGAIPTLIAISANANPGKQGIATALMYCGFPLGGALLGWLTLLALGLENWRLVFYVGGVGPLLLAGATMALLRLGSGREVVMGVSVAPTLPLKQALFGDGRAAPTALLGVAFFFSLLVLYVLLNWLPILAVGRGFVREQGVMAGTLLTSGGFLGILLIGFVIREGGRKGLAVILYIILALSLLALAHASSLGALLLSSFVTGISNFGAQLLLYVTAVGCYPRSIHGAGLGYSATMGRIGAVIGPIITGWMIKAGIGTDWIILAIIPGLAIALLAYLLLPSTHQPKVAC
jgi:MFS transporter, AAHS family, 3-hydroxyphenylpropionic acid transporter